MKKILVTGGNGFLGSYTVQELLKNPNNHITILSNIKKENDVINEKMSFIVADMRNEQELSEKVKFFDSIYHIAGNIQTEKEDAFQLHYDINTVGTLNILKACEKNNIKRLIFISTSEVYGNKLKENITEDEKKEPANDYSKSKLQAEYYCNEYSNHIKITVIRPPYIYGYGQYHKRLFPKIIEQALKYKKIDLRIHEGGNDFVYVKDAAKGIVLLGEREQQNNFEVFNISSGKFTTIKEVFDTVKNITGCSYDSPGIYGESKNFSLNIEKAKKVGYNPEYDLKRGISDFVEYYKRENKKGI